MTLPQRKPPRLKAYDYAAPGAYFITICARGRQCLFGSIPPTPVGVDARIAGLRSNQRPCGALNRTSEPALLAGGPRFGRQADPRADVPVHLTPLGQIVQKHLPSIPGITAYVVMPNHLHFLLVIPDVGSCGPMQASAPTVSQIVRIFKGKVAHDAGGSFFQRSFYDHIVRSERDYQEIYDYILTNPARWAMDKFYIEGESNT